jgi:hypothetical protein
VDVVQAFLGNERENALAWKNLLVNRDYLAKSVVYGIHDNVRYSVGQPMGAKSSWPMLAITHHLLVQLSAVRAGKIQI